MVMVDPNHKSPFSTGLMALSSRPDREVTFRWRLASPNTTDPGLAVHSISHFESVGIWLHKWEKKPLRSQRLWAQYWLSSLSGNQRPDHLWWTCVLYCACHAICIFPDPLQMSHSCQSCHRFATKSSRFAHCGRVQNPLRLPHKMALQSPKVVRTCGAFSVLSSKCASRRTLFEHLNFQKCSEAEVFCTFWLRNVLCATTACNFKSLIWPPAPAALASLLFNPPETQWIATFLPFHLHLLSSDSFSSLIFSDSSHLCFSICRKFDF